MTQNIRWWNWLSGWFRPRALAPSRTPVAATKRRHRRAAADFADHGTAFGLDLSLAPPDLRSTTKPKPKPKRAVRR
jgi:hypothetical protein